MRYNGNLAYDEEFEEHSVRLQKKVQEQKAEIKNRAKAEMVRKHKVLAVCAVMLAICAGFMISRNVAVYESKNEAAEFQKELNELKEYSSQKAFELDRSLDLDAIEETAAKKLNMVHPEKYQTVYVNIKQEDVTEVTAGEVEGIRGIFDIFTSEKQ